MTLRRLPPLAALALVTALGCASPEPAETPPEGMVWIPGGEFVMGSDSDDPNFADAKPVHRVRVDGFWMDATEVTNEQFTKFVEATGYKTVAERCGYSFVYVRPEPCDPSNCTHCSKWWKPAQGACWKHPEGAKSNIEGKGNYPVGHIAWDDAVAYCEWAGKRLPTEAEWERAARGGLERKPYYWGDELRPGGKWMANSWQGPFPCRDDGEDGFEGVAPVASYPPNGYGLYDVAGNHWEWCSDWYRPGYDVRPGEVRVNPTGPESSIDTQHRHLGIPPEPKRVQRGGSYLCSDNYCARYRAGGRMEGEPTNGLAHNGFRCVQEPARKKK